MSNLLVRDIPESLKQDLSNVARETGRSMSDEVKDMIRQGIAAHRAEKSGVHAKNAFEELRELFAPSDEESEHFAEIMNDIENGRKKDHVRSFSFDE
ncbi:hypothetical protein JJB09_00170 [Rhizobium sp. KVB221]|uniref:Antitoxin FitA-like ribbon-helix-helix domain-containing protein n=1 Tax=Rhizobium setariae TaxID=2801340 RepID=A0A937CKG0_9HYPH|nr:hypothetical protein [Rhizobium setariae]MBL0370431.1 hypothetical protein [Rhizobium setariae]